MHSHLDALQAMAPLNLQRVASEVHSVAKQASFYVAFGRDFGGFWRPKWMRKLMLGPVFFDVVLECVFASIFVRILDAPSLKNRALASTGARYLQNRRFRKRYEQSLIWAPFSDAETETIPLKTACTNTFFFDILL